MDSWTEIVGALLRFCQGTIAVTGPSVQSATLARSATTVGPDGSNPYSVGLTVESVPLAISKPLRAAPGPDTHS